MNIRQAKREDAPILDGLLTALIRYEHRYDANLNPDYTVTDNYANMMGHDSCKIWLAEEDGAVCGYLCAIVYDFPVYARPVVVLDALYVREEYRRRGIATALMAELKRFAASIKAHAIELKVYSSNAQALDLYTRSGFTETKKYLQLEVSP